MEGKILESIIKKTLKILLCYNNSIKFDLYKSLIYAKSVKISSNPLIRSSKVKPAHEKK